jgi:hypothetical protein
MGPDGGLVSETARWASWTRPGSRKPRAQRGRPDDHHVEDLGQTGVRGFGGDGSGILCFSADGTEPQVSSGALVINTADCNVLQ